MSARAQAEPNIEVHKFYGGAITAVAFLALVLQAFLNKYGAWAALLELPLLVTIYFGLSRRNPATGLLLGMVIGILQDAVSLTPLGLYGIAKTIVGFLASSLGSRLDTEHPLSRAALVFFFFYVQQASLAITEKFLLNQPTSFFHSTLVLSAVVNAVIAPFVFPLLDRLRRPS